MKTIVLHDTVDGHRMELEVRHIGGYLSGKFWFRAVSSDGKHSTPWYEFVLSGGRFWQTLRTYTSRELEEKIGVEDDSHS